MSDTDIPALEPTGDSDRWSFTVVDRWCAGPRGRPFLFGGAALAVAIAALERSTGRPVIWANMQYHAFAVPGTIITLHVVVDVQGRRLTQARLVGKSGDRLIVTVQATLGTGTPAPVAQLVRPPAIGRPEDYPVVRDRRIFTPGINERFEFRLVEGDYPDGREFSGQGGGRVTLWVRPLHDRGLDRPTLAMIADYVSLGVCDAAGGEVGSNSLDNMIRFVAEDGGEWSLVVIEIDALAGGIAHGGLRIFSPEGALLAIANTSLVLR